MTRYPTRDEAIAREIIEPIEAGEATADEFDIDAIADQVLGSYDDGYACQVEHDEFWKIVEQHPARRLRWEFHHGDHDFLIAETLNDGEWVEHDVESIPANEDHEPYQEAEQRLLGRLGEAWEGLTITTND